MNSVYTEVSNFKPVFLDNTVILTVDVEDYFMSPESIPFETWPQYTSTIYQGMERCLNLFSHYGAKGTFFFVGWLAERYPQLVKWTMEEGHEIGSHSYNHMFVQQMDEKEFESNISKSLGILRTIVPDDPIVGFRAPAFSLQIHKKWQFDVLHKNGIIYDSSICPHQTYLYGDKYAPRHPYQLYELLEIPPAVIQILNKRFPTGGGGTLRILPEMYIEWARKRYQAEGFPPVIYIHPWELVPEHPKTHLPLKLSLIHWFGIKTTERKVRTILEKNKTMTMKEYYDLLTSINH